MDNILGFLGAFYLIPSLIIGMIGFLLGWFLKPSSKREGDLTIEGEGALRAEADSLRARVQELEGRVTSRDQEVSDLKSKLAVSTDASLTATAKTSEADDTYALEWQNRYLAARVKYLDSRLAEMGSDSPAKAKPVAKKAAPKTKKAPAKKTPAKKASAKKKAVAKPKAAAVAKTATTKKAAPKKAVAKKPSTKKAASMAATKKAPASKAKATSKKDAAFERYYEKVKKYDAKASRKVVQSIVDYCGVSLRSRDSSLVACSDESELRTVADGFVTKKLGIETGQMDLVKSVCEQMKETRLKSRVTFYYLAAKKARKLGVFK